MYKSEEECWMKFGFLIFKVSDVSNAFSYAALADKLGFNSVWVPDEVPGKGFFDPYVLLGALALKTKNVYLGTNITNPYTRHPALICSAFNTLYNMTGGRVIIGISVGGEYPFKPLRIPMWYKPLTAMKESIEIINKLTSGEKVTYDGSVFQVEELELEPKPDKKIPIYVGARGPKMIQLAGRYADGILGSVPIPQIPYMIENLKHGAKKAKRDLSNFVIANCIPFAVSKKREVAYDIIKFSIAIMFTLFNDKLIINSGVSIEKMNRIRKAISENNYELIKEEITDEEINKFSIAGTVKDVYQRIIEMKELGINLIMIQPPYGDSPEYAIEAVARSIIPNFK